MNAKKNLVIITHDFSTGGHDYRVGDRYIFHKDGNNRNGWIAITNDEFHFSRTIPKQYCHITSEHEIEMAKLLKEKGIL